MLRRALLVTLVWIACGAQSGPAFADPCRTLNMVQRQLAEHRSSGKSELRQVRRRMASMGCGAGRSVGQAPRKQVLSKALLPRQPVPKLASAAPKGKPRGEVRRRKADTPARAERHSASPAAERKPKVRRARKEPPKAERKAAPKPESVLASKEPAAKKRPSKGVAAAKATSAPRSKVPESRPVQLAAIAKTPAPKSSARQSYPKGTFRTLCVRSCDGYYFPVSFSTTGDHFDADQQVCQQMCPAADVELYFHKVGGSAQEMVSLDGGNYADLPNAFGYQAELQPECACQAAEIQTVSIGSHEPEQQSASQPRVPVFPAARPAPGEDPETLLNRTGGLDPTPREPSTELMASSRPGVRVVHPAWNESTVQVMASPVPN